MQQVSCRRSTSGHSQELRRLDTEAVTEWRAWPASQPQVDPNGSTEAHAAASHNTARDGRTTPFRKKDPTEANISRPAQRRFSLSAQTCEQAGRKCTLCKHATYECAVAAVRDSSTEQRRQTSSALTHLRHRRREPPWCPAACHQAVRLPPRSTLRSTLMHRGLSQRCLCVHSSCARPVLLVARYWQHALTCVHVATIQYALMVLISTASG
jgi:hypothetical protein